MSFNQNLQNNLQQWFQTTDDYKTFLTNIVSEEDARKIIDGYTAFIEEKKARSQAKIDGINNYDWILSRLQEKVPANEKITGMSLEEYATHISSQQTILFKDSIPQFEDNMFDVPNIPQIKDFFESAIDDPQDAPIHNIAGATLYEYSKTKGYSMEPTEAVILATNGINTAKILYHCATGKIDQLSGRFHYP